MACQVARQGLEKLTAALCLRVTKLARSPSVESRQLFLISRQGSASRLWFQCSIAGCDARRPGKTSAFPPGDFVEKVYGRLFPQPDRGEAISGQLEGLQAVPAEESHEREIGVGVAFCPPMLPASEAPREEL